MSHIIPQSWHRDALNRFFSDFFVNQFFWDDVDEVSDNNDGVWATEET